MNRLDPKALTHIPIGIPNTVDMLKTFVEPEGCFSPGLATYGIYFWLLDRKTGRLRTATEDDAGCEWGLRHGYMLPWSRWQAGPVTVQMEVCHVRRTSPAGEVHLAAARVLLTNRSQEEQDIALYAAIRPLGPAGGRVESISVASGSSAALLVNGSPALIADNAAARAGVAESDSVGEMAIHGRVPSATNASSPAGDCSGALVFDMTLAKDATRRTGFICPVLPGRFAAGHDWDGCSTWAQFDLMDPGTVNSGTMQPDPGLAWYRAQNVDSVFDEAWDFWQSFCGRTGIALPDSQWSDALRAILGHVSMAMNEDAPDVTVVNYNVYNRDGIYTTNILQKSGRFELAARAIDYFLAHPFNGRTIPEADNPGQLLWIIGEHWLMTGDRRWLERVYPSVVKLAELIIYCRTTPGPHEIKADSLEHGEALPPDQPGERVAQKRHELKPGSCDGYHPEYTEAFDIAGLRAAAGIAGALDRQEQAACWLAQADGLLRVYGEKFGADLRKGYGNYSVLWPCRLYPLNRGPAHDQFRMNGSYESTSWRYFPLATAHQGLYTGNRNSGCDTIRRHLDHPQMHGWYVFDEGGGSGAGGWAHVRTNWNPSVAMPHGWAIAELWLLMRDCLVFEDSRKLVLLSGVPPEWFRSPIPIELTDMPTHFGLLSLRYEAKGDNATLTIHGGARPPDGFTLRLPPGLPVAVSVDGYAASLTDRGECTLPSASNEVRISLRPV